MKRPIILIAILIMTAAPVLAEDSAITSALKLVEEQERLEQLRQRLELAETKDTKKDEILPRLQKGVDANTLSQLPDSIVIAGMDLKRSMGRNGLVYDITCSRMPAVRVLEAIRETSGLELEIHQDAGREALLGEVSLNLQREDMAGALQIICGTQGLGVGLTDRKIVVAPLTALAPVPIEKILRELAVENYQAALMRFSASANAPRAYLGIARYYAMTGFEETAVEAIQRLLGNNPESEAAGPAMILLGDCYSSLRQYEKARGAYYRYVDNFPGTSTLPDVLMKIGKAWTDEQKWDQAIPVFEGVFREWAASPEAPYARMQLAECLMRLEQHEKALEQLQVLEQQSQRFAQKHELRLVLAECLMKLKRYGSARVQLKQVIETANDAALAERASYVLGDSFLEESSSLSAIESYRNAMQAFPAGTLRRTAPLRLARAYLQMGLYVRAEDQLRTLAGSGVDPLELKPVIMELAAYHESMGNCERTLAILAQLPDRDTCTDTRLLKAKAEYDLGRFENALADIDAAIRLSPENSECRAKAMKLAGLCHEAMNKPALAAIAYGGAAK